MDGSFVAPNRYDFDKKRADFPLNAWGSRMYKCDVISSQANQLLRRGRIDQKRTIPIRNQVVIARYKKIAGVQKNGDHHDIGLSVLDAMKYWNAHGWQIHDKDYRISVYGEIPPNERELMRAAIFMFRGIHIGFWLPSAVSENIFEWDWPGLNSEEWKPGGLGGALAYCKAYDPDGYQLLYAGEQIYVTNRFVERFSDEVWIVLENFDYWVQQVLDVKRLVKRVGELIPGSQLLTITEGGDYEVHN